MLCEKCGRSNPDSNWTCSGCGELLPRPEAETYKRTARPTSRRRRKSSPVMPIAVVAALVLLAGLTSWYFFLRDPAAGGPGETMNAYYGAISENDCEKLYEMAPADQLTGDRNKDISDCSRETLLAEGMEFSNYETLEESVDGDSATVRYQIAISMGELSKTAQLSAILVQEDGRWKVETPMDPNQVMNFS